MASGTFDMAIMLFKTKEEAYAKLESCGNLLTMKKNKSGNTYWELNQDVANGDDDSEEDSEEGNSGIDQLLISYYGGCGEIDNFYVREISYGEKFASWDLD
jgi:hypothetical protein